MADRDLILTLENDSQLTLEDDLILILDDDDLVLVISEDILLAIDDDIPLTLTDEAVNDTMLVDDVPHAQHYADYKGPYVVKPVLYNEQKLLTMDKHMTDNVTVKEIPVTWTSNPHGGNTVVIG